jgi:hypothetical protein
MANMKIVSMVAHEARRVQAETEADIATALAVVGEEGTDPAVGQGRSAAG